MADVDVNFALKSCCSLSQNHQLLMDGNQQQSNSNNEFLMSAVSQEAQDLGDSMTFLGNQLENASSTILPIALATLAFGISAYLLKRFIYSS